MFDPYHAWLGISPVEQPASHYRLLGIRDFETDSNVIANAADRQMGFVKQFATGPNGADSQQVLNQLAAAKRCLLGAKEKAAYDAKLKAQLGPARPSAGQFSDDEIAEATSALKIADISPLPEPVSQSKPRPRPASSKASAGALYAQVSAFVAVVLAFAGVLYAWHVLDAQKQEIAKAQAVLDQRTQAAPPAPAPPAPQAVQRPSLVPSPTKIASVNQSAPSPAVASPSATAPAAPPPTPPVADQQRPRTVRPAMPAQPAVPSPQASNQAAAVNSNPAIASRAITPQFTRPVPTIEVTRESLARLPWQLLLPNGRQLSSANLVIPSFAEQAMNDPALQTYPWKSGDVEGFFKFKPVEKSPTKIDGYGLTTYGGVAPRTFAKYSAGERDGDFLMLDEGGKPLLFAQYRDDSLYGLLCYCTAGAPAIIQDRRGTDVKSSFVVQVQNGKLAAAEAKSDDPEFSSPFLRAVDLLGALDKEHTERGFAFKKWFREEQEKQRRQMASQLSVEKRAATSQRNKERDAANDAALKRIMWQSRGY